MKTANDNGGEPYMNSKAASQEYALDCPSNHNVVE